VIQQSSEVQHSEAIVWQLQHLMMLSLARRRVDEVIHESTMKQSRTILLKAVEQTKVATKIKM
jgi:hypothetical protein